MVANYDYSSSIVYSQTQWGYQENHLTMFDLFLVSWISRSVDWKAIDVDWE